MRESTRQSRRSGADDASAFERAFGRILQEARIERKISQEQLGFEAGYHRTYISLIERGLKNPSLKTVLQLAQTLNIPASELVRRLEVKLRS